MVVKKRFWRCFACEQNFNDEDMKGPIPFKEKNEDYFVCYSCGRDLGLKNMEQGRYLLLQCPGCSRQFLPLLEFDPSKFHAKIITCPFCKEGNTFVFSPKPDGSIIRECRPDEYKKLYKNS